MVIHESNSKGSHFLPQVLFGILFLSIFVIPWFYGLAAPRHQLSSVLVVLAFFLIFLLSRSFPLQTRLQPSRIDFWVVATLVLGTIYVFLSVLPYQSLLTFARLLSIVAAYLMTRALIQDSKRLSAMLWAFLVMGAVYSAYGLFQH